MQRIIASLAIVCVTGCATLTESAMTPISFSFADNSKGTCSLSNKRGSWSTDVPGTIEVRKSDDALLYECETSDGRAAQGSIRSEMGAKIVASAVFIDLGITDMITDKHRQYTQSFVIPLEASDHESGSDRSATYAQLEALSDLRDRGIITEEEYEAEKQRLLQTNEGGGEDDGAESTLPADETDQSDPTGSSTQ